MRSVSAYAPSCAHKLHLSTSNLPIVLDNGPKLVHRLNPTGLRCLLFNPSSNRNFSFCRTFADLTDLSDPSRHTLAVHLQLAVESPQVDRLAVFQLERG